MLGAGEGAGGSEGEGERIKVIHRTELAGPPVLFNLGNFRGYELDIYFLLLLGDLDIQNLIFLKCRKVTPALKNNII